MTNIEFGYAEFESVRADLVKRINADISENEKQLLMSFTKGEPDWSFSPVAGIVDLPAVKWKLLNIQKMDKAKREQMVNLLRFVFD